MKAETVQLMLQNQVPRLTPISIAPDWPPGQYGFGYGGAVRVDSDTTIAGAPGPSTCR